MKHEREIREKEEDLADNEANQESSSDESRKSSSDESRMSQTKEDAQTKDVGNESEESTKDAHSEEEQVSVSGDESGAESEDYSEQEYDTEDENDLELIQAQSKSYRDAYGKIMWAKQGKFIWWPCCIYNPMDTASNIRELGMKSIGKKHLVYFFGTNNFAVIPLKMLHDWEEYYDQHKSGKGNQKKYAEDFENAKIQAAEEFEKPESERMEGVHTSIPEKKERKKKASKKQQPPKKAKPTKPAKKRQTSQGKGKTKGKKPKKQRTPEPSSDEELSESDEVQSDETSEHEQKEASETSEEEFESRPVKRKKRARPSKAPGKEKNKMAPKDQQKATRKITAKEKEPQGAKKQRALERINKFSQELPPPEYNLDREGVKKPSRKPIKKRVGQIQEGDRQGPIMEYKRGSFKMHAGQKVQNFVSKLPDLEIDLEREQRHEGKPKKKDSKNKEEKPHTIPKKKKVREETFSEEHPQKKVREKALDTDQQQSPDDKKARKRKLGKDDREHTPSKKPKETETPLDRMIRMRKVIEKFCAEETLDVRRATKSLVKLGQVPELYTAEMLSNTGIASLISNLRKHENIEISKTAKKLRKFMKAKLQGVESTEPKKNEVSKEQPKPKEEDKNSIELPKNAYDNVTETTRKDQLQAFSTAHSVSRGHFEKLSTKETSANEVIPPKDDSKAEEKIEAQHEEKQQEENQLEGPREKALILLSEVIAQPKNERYLDLCKKIEYEAFMLDEKSTGLSYKRHIRNAAFTLEGAKGQQLCQKLLVGSLAISDFLKLSPEEINVIA